MFVFQIISLQKACIHLPISYLYFWKGPQEISKFSKIAKFTQDISKLLNPLISHLIFFNCRGKSGISARPILLLWSFDLRSGYLEVSCPYFLLNVRIYIQTLFPPTKNSPDIPVSLYAAQSDGKEDIGV